MITSHSPLAMVTADDENARGIEGVLLMQLMSDVSVRRIGVRLLVILSSLSDI